MEKTQGSITFTCPTCKQIFEFDQVGEYELVFCPVCGIDLMTIRKGQEMTLEPFALNPSATQTETASAELLLIEVNP